VNEDGLAHWGLLRQKKEREKERKREREKERERKRERNILSYASL